MELDWLVFPSPDTSYTVDKCNGELIFIPKTKLDTSNNDLNNNINLQDNSENNNFRLTKEISKKSVNINIPIDSKLILILDKAQKNNTINNDDTTNHIPCLFLRANTSSLCPKYALFFHGNAEDVNLASEILNHIRFTLSINVIAPEYPGYGIYPGRPTEEQIFEDSLHVHNYLTKTLKVSPNNIIIFGRSLGTSPSTYLASQRDVSALILISPMMSIGGVVKDIVGTLVSWTIKDRFKNIKMIGDVKCPILIIHGQNDTLIKYYHSTELYNSAKAPCELILPENMDHNEFDFFQEFSEPLLDFISRNAIFTYTLPCNNKIPSELSIVPEEFCRPYKQWNCLTKIFKKFSIN